ncbi:tetratricopeptide repeat protein [Acidobacteriota bacterium]
MKHLLIVLSRLTFWAFLLLVVLAPFVILPQAYDYADHPKAAFIQAGAVILFFLCLAKRMLDNERRILLGPFDLPLIILLIWSALSLVWAHNRYEGLMTWMHWTACALLYWIGLHSLRDRKDVVRLLMAFFFSGFCVALLGITQYLFQVDWIPQTRPPSSTFANTNLAAQYVVLTLPLGVVFFLRTRRRLAASGYALAVTSMACFPFYGVVKAGWLALFIQTAMFCTFLTIERKNQIFSKKHKVLLAALSCGVFFLMFNLTPAGFRWRFSQSYEEVTSMLKPPGTQDVDQNTFSKEPVRNSLRERKICWLNTLAMIGDHPLRGVGLSNFQIQYPIYSRRTAVDLTFGENMFFHRTHNDYLQVLSELGLLALFPLAWLCFALARIAYRSVRDETDGETRLFAAGIITGLLGLFVTAFFSFPFQSSIPPLGFCCFLSALVVLVDPPVRLSKEARPVPTDISVKRTAFKAGALLVIMLGVLAGVAVFQYRWIRSDIHFKKMGTAFARSNWPIALEEGRFALQYNPSRKKLYYPLGMTHNQLGQYQEAIQALTKADAAYPYTLFTLIELGHAHAYLGNYQKALDHYRRALALKPEFAIGHHSIGLVYLEQNDLERAVEHFKKALALNPSIRGAERIRDIIRQHAKEKASP